MPARCRAASGPPASPQDFWSACASAALPCRRRFSRKSSPSICKFLPAGRHRRKYRRGIVLRAGRSRTLRLREKHNQPPMNTYKTKSAYRRSSALINRRPLLQREFEVEDLFAAGGFVEAVQVNGGVALQGGLEIEKAAGRLSGREHPRGQCAAFDLPFVQRVLLALEHFDPTGGAVDCAGALRRLQVTDILGGGGFDA